MSDLPEPLPSPPIPPDCDLRALPFTPIFRARLFGSAFHARATDAEWRAGFTLWLKSWDQYPGGSLPDDDIELCRLAELGRDQRTWKKVRAVALHGWTKCSDGRLYHPVVTEGVLEAWGRRASAIAKGKAGASKRWSAANAQAMPEPMPEVPRTDGPTIAEAMPGDSKGQGQGQGQQTERKRGADAPAGYAFSGRVIHLKADDFDRWKASYSHIPDLMAALQKADGYYAEHPPADGKWFFAVSRWLERENADAMARKAKNGKPGELVLKVAL